MQRWQYRTFKVQWQPVPGSQSEDQKRPSIHGTKDEWCIDFSDGCWVGWHEILGNLSSGGWDVICIVPEDSYEGTVRAYRLFVKRPAET